MPFFPEKEGKNKTRCVAGGNLINYPWDVSTAMAKRLLANIFLNNIISTPDARFLTMDIKNFYFDMPIERKGIHAHETCGLSR